MKGLNININISSCTSEESTSIISSPNMEVLLPSSSSSSTFSTFNPGSRAIDRHNPIIMDERRSGISSTNGSCASTPIRTPCTHHVLQKKPPTPNNSPKPLNPHKKGNKLPTLTKKKTSKTRNNVTNTTTTNTTATTAKSPVYSSDIVVDGDDDGGGGGYKGGGRRSFSKPSELIMKAAAAGVDYISPPESSRYLLDDTSFLEVLSDLDPVLELKPPFDDFNDLNEEVEVVKSECVRPPKPTSSIGSSIGSPDQVVVLRVSLHCRGCERKMKKHLSRMPGVTSFNIDFAAKKVTVVGDVTPLGVLTSISKVKNAKLWTPATTISSSSSTRNMQLNHKINNNQL